MGGAWLWIGRIMGSRDDSECEPARRTGTPGSPVVDVSVVDRSGTVGAGDVSWLEGMVAAAVGVLERGELPGVVMVRGGVVRVGLVSEREMARAHAAHLGEAGPTDVLTFDMREASEGGGEAEVDVEIMVCVDEARRRAVEIGHEARREMLLYVVHGLLHVLGHDDGDASSSSAMHVLEDAILERIGVGATYGCANGDGATGGGGA